MKAESSLPRAVVARWPESRPIAQLVLPAAVGCAAAIWLAHDRSVAARTSTLQDIATPIMLVSAVWTVAAALAVGAQQCGSRPFKWLAATVGLSMLAINLLPSLPERVHSHESELASLAAKVERGETITWPVRIGGFTFLAGEVMEDGVLLRTTAASWGGDYGLIHSPGKLPFAGEMVEVERLAPSWYVVGRE